MRLIAIEEHILTPGIRETWASAPPPHDPVSAIGNGGETGERLADLGEGRLALMDEQGVDVQVLSLTTPGLHNLEPGPAVDESRRVNDLIADACPRHPDRFQGFAAVPRRGGLDASSYELFITLQDRPPQHLSVPGSCAIFVANFLCRGAAKWRLRLLAHGTDRVVGRHLRPLARDRRRRD